RDAPVPEEWPIGPLPTGPNDPTATPAPHRSRDGEPLPTTALAVSARIHPSRLLSPVERSSSHDAPHTHVGRASAPEWSVDRWWRHGRRQRHETFSGVFVAGQKPSGIRLCGRSVWRTV